MSTERIRYYHGGPPGLSMILPSQVTRAKSLADYGAKHVCRRDRVYVVTSRNAALLYAAVHSGGMVYEVQPLGALEPDTDFHHDGSDGLMSYCCKSARVIKARKLQAEERQVALQALRWVGSE